ncbi:MAG: hypothetical protein AABX37_05885 [Nanoarchaeota archaeon]
MLIENQEIIYFRNEEELTRLTAENIRHIPFGFQQYIRFLQPFTDIGEPLSIPKDIAGGKTTDHLSTSPVTERTAEKDSLVFRTRNSTYTIKYVHIDLERMLLDGKSQSINIEDKFPYK